MKKEIVSSVFSFALIRWKPSIRIASNLLMNAHVGDDYQPEGYENRAFFSSSKSSHEKEKKKTVKSISNILETKKKYFLICLTGCVIHSRDNASLEHCRQGRTPFFFLMLLFATLLDYCEAKKSIGIYLMKFNWDERRIGSFVIHGNNDDLQREREKKQILSD